ncbi:hypothetical protein AcV5_003178 [Taiwanofungus camphoratus]|nr:hypothetical protein AcV5_003178 [Antrodia cinnamomea]
MMFVSLARLISCLPLAAEGSMCSLLFLKLLAIFCGQVRLPRIFTEHVYSHRFLAFSALRVRAVGRNLGLVMLTFILGLVPVVTNLVKFFTSVYRVIDGMCLAESVLSSEVQHRF